MPELKKVRNNGDIWTDVAYLKIDLSPKPKRKVVPVVAYYMRENGITSRITRTTYHRLMNEKVG